MKRFEPDWPYIREYTLVPALTAVVAVAAMLLSMSMHDDQAELHRQLSADHLVAQEDYDALVYQRRIVANYHRRYQQFETVGFVGMESRLDWIEALREASAQMTLPRISYLIEPQLTAIAPVESILGDDIRIHVSKLGLEMSLVHELDLLRFVDELQQSAPGLISIDACTLEWQADADAPVGIDANIVAECTVDIFSVITSDVSPESST